MSAINWCRSLIQYFPVFSFSLSVIAFCSLQSVRLNEPFMLRKLIFWLCIIYVHIHIRLLRACLSYYSSSAWFNARSESASTL